MNEEIRRATGIILRAPLTRRTVRELLYCGLGGLAGVAGFWITIVMLALGLTISASVLGTVIGLLLLTLALRVSRRLGALHRRLAVAAALPGRGAAEIPAGRRHPRPGSTSGCGTGPPGGRSPTA